jgi:hypothetical protein
MNSHLWWVHATLFPTTCWAMNVCELTLAVSHPPQEKNRWFKWSHVSRSSIRSRWCLPVSFLAPRIDFRSCDIYLLFVRLPLCNKVLWLYCDIYLYTLCYYICCLLWRMYEMHVAEPPKLSGPHAPVLVSKTSDDYACAPNNLTGSVRVPRGPRINDLTPRSQD